jgi:cobalt/nickel transport system permease protein
MDGILTAPWLVGGFVVAGLLACWAAKGVRDEEIPRVALLAAAFFVSSLLHAQLGPTSFHLLFNGLVGVVLGRRAPLAILLGLFLQAIFGHGGFWALGVNTCVLALPALLAWSLFVGLARLPWLRRPRVRATLVAAAGMAAPLGAVFLVAVVATNHWNHFLVLDLRTAVTVVGHPAVLGAAAALGLVAMWGEARLHTAPEFTLGMLIGGAAVLATVALNALVLLLGAHDDLHTLVAGVIVLHLPLVPIEGVLVGYTTGFLARVKPALLGLVDPEQTKECCAEPASRKLEEVKASAPSAVSRATAAPPALPLALLAMLLLASPAHAHRLRGGYSVLADHRVQVEAWFDITDTSAAGARVQVFRGNTLLEEGKMDSNGVFVLQDSTPGPLRVVITAGPGHQTEVSIPEDALHSEAPRHQESPPPSVPRLSRETELAAKDLLLGVTFLLALAAFVLSVRNARRRP